MSGNYLEPFSDAELEDLSSECKKGLLACAMNKSYTVAGQSFERAEIPKLKEMLGDIAAEQRRRAGTSKPRIFTARIGRVF
ncbi:hypothetical protein [Maridesulfovibrio ferrireducens]|uniref:hypothetical protein n=1 Tax=Maridesulfovibrio ferrireducens TaxID=246191 RepID=UPI001A1B6ED0|nr:hypothetical protein [Maridesulfovibrio ferrireducens]MBI9112261.1 hypothetical protein [Maridesulfovibrio ferrireducens]